MHLHGNFQVSTTCHIDGSIYEKKWPYPQKIATNCFIVLNALGGHTEPQKKGLKKSNHGKVVNYQLDHFRIC